MDQLFLIKLCASIAVGSAWVVTISIIAERAGSRIGGLVGGLPSTVLISYFFIGWTQGDAAAFDATTSFPMTYSVAAAVTLLSVCFEIRSSAVRIAGYLGVWMILQGIVVFSDFAFYEGAILIWIVFCGLLIFYIFAAGQHAIADAIGLLQKPISLPVKMITSGAIVGSAVLFGKLGGPIIASIFAAFPGVYLSTLLISNRQGGHVLSRALLLPMLISGSINCVIYVAIFRATVMEFGLITSSVFAIVSMAVSVPICHLLISKLFTLHGTSPPRDANE